MGLETGQLANLFNGVSQQPPALRSPSQHEALTNALSSLVDGLGKRPPTNFVDKLNSLVDSGAFIHIINRDSSEKYVVVLRDEEVLVYDLLTGDAKTVTTPDGVAYLGVTTPREQFAAVTIADHTFIVNKTVEVAMGAAATGGTAKGSKQKFADLPGAPVAGDVWKIEGDDSNAFDDYYVKYDASGVWVESTEVGIPYQFDATTMPHKLVRNADGTWTFSKITWADRLVGSEESNPEPSFVGQAISDIFFYRNRLGFTAGESCIMSRAGEYYTFWAKTVTDVLDSDPVDFDLAHTEVSIIRHAFVYNKTLLLFTDKAQFQITTADVLKPGSTKADVATEFESSWRAKPVGAGQDVFFVTERGNYSAIREYFVEEDAVSNDAADVSAHVPKYLPKNVFKLAASTGEDVVVALSLDERNAVWVYKYFWGDEDKKVQSSWQKFEIDSGATILGCGFVGSKLYLVVQRADGMHLEWVDFQNAAADLTLADGSTIVVLLDRKVSLTGVYNAGTNLTTWTLPYSDSAGTFKVILSDDFAGRVGESLTISRPSATTITAVGDYSGGACFVGRTYEFVWELSEQFVRDENNVAKIGDRLQLRTLTLLFSKTGYFRVRVTMPDGAQYTYPYTGKVLGTLVLGKPSVQTGDFTVPIWCKSSNVTIEIINDSYLPCQFQSAKWVGFFLEKAAQR